MRSDQTSATTIRLFKLIPLLLGVIVVVGAIIIFNVKSAALYNELAALDLVPKPERLTELYFNDSANLPAAVKENQVIKFAFVIHNLEGTDYQYAYQVSVMVNGTRHIVDRGKVVVKNNHYYVKNERVKLLNSPGSQDVLVELLNKQQSIDFYCSVLTANREMPSGPVLK